MAYSDSNFFDKLCDGFGNCMTMEQIARFALTSKVILSYKIDFLNSFYDQLMEGLWKRSSNGCIYPLDNRYEKVLYVEINEDYEVNLEKSLENLRNLSTAHKVFDERPDSLLSTNQGHIALSEDNQDNIALVFVFDNEDEIQIDDECHGNEDTQMDGIYELRSESDNNFVEEIQQPNAHNVLDELPIPTFIIEMAQAAKIAELDSVQGASLRRISTLERTLYQGYYSSDQMSPHCNRNHGESLNSPCPSTQVSMNLVPNNASPLLYSDLDLFVGSNLSMILSMEAYVNKVFGLEHGCRTFLHFKELHGLSIYQICWDSQLLKLNEEYVWEWQPCNNSFLDHTCDPGGKGLKGCNEPLINSLDCDYSVWHEKMVPQMKVFDPGSVIIEIISLRVVHVTDIFVVISYKSEGISTASLSGQIRGDSTLNSIILHDGISHDTEVNFLVKTCGTAILKMAAFLLSVFNLLGGAFRLKLTACAFTLEDKGDFEEVGNGNVLALHWTIQHAEDHLTINYDTVTFTTITSFGFNPGGVKYEHYPNMGSVLDMIVWVFDPRESGNSSRSTSVLSSSDLVYKIGINRNRMLYLMFFYHENDIFQSGNGGYVRRVNYWVHHGFATINSKKTSKSLPNHVLVGHMKQLLCTHCHSPLDYSDMLFGYGNENQNATILIFDPSGFECWPKMRNRLEAYRYNGCNYEDTQIYVFDPGGPLMWLAMDAMVTNPKPGLGMCIDTITCL